MEEWDLYDAQLTNEQEVRILARMRAEDPVHWNDQNQHWILTRQSEIRQVARDADLFSVEPKGSLAAFESHFSFATLDGPEHDRVRTSLAVAFKARAVKQLEAITAELTDRAIDKIIAQGHCDFAKDIAWPVPIQVIAAMVGFEDTDLMIRYAEVFDRLFIDGDASLAGSGLQPDDAAIVEEFLVYVEALIEDRRQNPQDDLISMMLGKNDPTLFDTFKKDLPDWLPQDSEGVVGFFFFLVMAGAETTVDSLSLGILSLLEHPDQMELLTRNPDLIPQAAQEIFRWAPPTRAHRRVVMRDTELNGKKLAAGDSVLMVWLSANRDEAAFEDPAKFRIDRDHNDHLTFGLGSHFCLGSKLATMEVEVVIRRVLERMKHLRFSPNADVVRRKTALVNGLKHLPIEFQPAP